jgi:hypothetical protein
MNVETAHRKTNSKTLKKRLPLGKRFLTVLALSLCLSAPAIAFEELSLFSDIFSFFGVDVSEYLEYLDEAFTFYEAIANENLQEIMEGVVYAAGEIGIPIPSSLEEGIQAFVDQESVPGPFAVGSEEYKQLLLTLSQAEQAKAQVEFNLGADGQEEIYESKEASAEDAAEASEAAQSAQRAITSQDVLKSISTQLASLNSLQRRENDESVDNRPLQAQILQATATTAKYAADERWAKQVENEAANYGSISSLSNMMGALSPQALETDEAVASSSSDLSAIFADSSLEVEGED